VESFICRFKQIEEGKEFMWRKLKESGNFDKVNDLVMFVGDFN